MSWITLSHYKVKTRKPHLCFGCGKRYSAGNEMYKTAAVDGGDFSSTYNCLYCEEFMIGPIFDWRNHEEGIAIGELWEYDEYRKMRKERLPMLYVDVATDIQITLKVICSETIGDINEAAGLILKKYFPEHKK